MVSESESVTCTRFVPFCGSSRSISRGVVEEESGGEGVVSVMVLVKRELEIVGVSSVCGRMVGSGSVMFSSGAVFSECSSSGLLGSWGGGVGCCSQSRAMCPWPLHFLQMISGHLRRECPTALHSLQMGC